MRAMQRRGAGWLAAVLLAALCSSCRFGILVEGYSSQLECSPDRQVLMWPLDPAGSRFGVVVTRPAGRAGGIEELAWDQAVEKLSGEPLGSATILLDPEPSPELRGRSSDLIRKLEARNPAMGAHVVVGPEPLGPVGEIEELHAALLRLFEVARERRFRESLRGVVRWEQDDPSLHFGLPHCLILPAPSDPAGFYVAGDGENPVWSSDEDERPIPVQRKTREEVHGFLVGMGAGLVWILAPQNATPESRAALNELFEAVTAAPQAEGASMPLVIMWPSQPLPPGLDDEEAVRTLVLEPLSAPQVFSSFWHALLPPTVRMSRTPKM